MTENHIIIVIEEDSTISLFIQDECIISEEQRHIVDSILCVSKPSVVLKVILFLEIRFNFIVN